MTHIPTRLHTALRAHAKGLYACEAATELLISHDSWLHSSLAIPGASGRICFSGHRNGDPESKPVPVLTIPDDPEAREDPYLTSHLRCTASS